MAQYTPKTWTTGETILATELNALEAAAAAAVPKADADAAYDAKGAATAAQAAAVQRANHTGTQAASTITGLATVATSGAYTDLSAKPTIPTVGAAGAGAAVALSSTDASVTNSRTPTAHTASHAAGGSDAIPPASLVRATAAAYAATITPNAATTDVLNVAALTGNLTLANPTGTPIDGQNLRVRLAQDATGSRAVTFGTAYAFGTDVTTSLIPTAASAAWEMLFAWHAGTSKWRATAIVRGF